MKFFPCFLKNTTEFILEKNRESIMSNIPPSVPTIGQNKTKFLHVHEPMFFICREIQVCSMQYLQWNTQSMQHECCELVFLQSGFLSPTLFESKYHVHENAEDEHLRDPQSTGESDHELKSKLCAIYIFNMQNIT